MDANALDTVLRAFCSAAALATDTTQHTKPEQYQRMAALGKILLENNMGNMAGPNGKTPLELMSALAAKHGEFASMVRTYDATPRPLTPTHQIHASGELGVEGIAKPSAEREL